jgi:hypothetical protein
VPCSDEVGVPEGMPGLHFDCQVGTNGFEGRAHRHLVWLFKPYCSGASYEEHFKDCLLFSESD